MKVTLEFSAIVSAESSRLAKTRNNSFSNSAGDGAAIAVWNEGEDAKLTKAANG